MRSWSVVRGVDSRALSARRGADARRAPRCIAAAVNRNGELVGIVFDGNLPSLVWNFVFTQEEGRATSVHAGAIVETLRKVYDVPRRHHATAASLRDRRGIGAFDWRGRLTEVQ